MQITVEWLHFRVTFKLIMSQITKIIIIAHFAVTYNNHSFIDVMFVRRY